MSMYNNTIPAWSNSLRCLKGFLQKAEQHAESNGFASENLLNSRLFADMFPLIKQIQIACDLVARGGARLSQAELPSFPDDETTFDQLYARIDNVLDYVNQLDADTFEGAENREVEVPAGGDRVATMSGQRYVLGFIIPNLYFHITTAYNILRTNGVPLGKYDFLVPGGQSA